MSVGTLAVKSMAKDKQATQPVKLPMDVVESARIIAGFTGENMGELIGNAARETLAKREKEEIAKRVKGTK